MKKRLLIAAWACLTGLGQAAADELIIGDVTVPQGGTAQLAVNYNFTTTTEKVGFTFSLALPEGISFVKDESGDPVYVKDQTSIDKLNIMCPGEGNFAGMPANTSANIKGTAGTLLTLTLQADASLAVGSTHTVSVTKVTFQERVDGSVRDINLDDFTFTVTIGEPADPRTVLDETSTTAPEAATAVDVRVRRTIKAGQWSTICLPFAMTEAQCKEAFGSDVQLAEFTGWTTTDYDEDDNPSAIKVTFANVTAIAANTPYIIKVSEPVTEFTADGVTIEPEEEPSVTVGKRSKGTLGTFTGSYVPTTIDEESLFLSDNQFWYSTGKTQMKGFRAYFYFQDVLGSYYEDAASKNIVMVFDGTATGIKRREAPNAVGEEQWYNLAGQRVMQPAKGLYIKNGKKIVK